MSIYLFDSKKESFSEFIYKSLKKLSKHEKFDFDSQEYNENAFAEITKPGFDNLLYINNQELLITPTDEDKEYYKFRFTKVNSTFSINMGVELETCFELDCTGTKLPKNMIDKLKHVNKTKSTKNKKKEWTELVIYHLTTNVIPLLSGDFIDRFNYAYIVPIKDAKNGLYLDMSNGRTVSSSRKIDGYKTLIFIPDSSIKCNKDNSKGYRLPCEIVSPVISSIQDLDILLNGLTNANCNLSNTSTGYHVNISAVNNKGKIIPITRALGVTLLQNWMQYEEKHYFELRGEGNRYAKNLKQKLNSENIRELLSYVIRRNNNSVITDTDYNSEYGLKYWYGSYLLNNEKYISMTNHKKNDVIEFRVFPSKTDVRMLLKYTQDGIDVMTKSMNQYIKNAAKIITGLQMNYLRFKYQTRAPFKKFGGYFEEFNFVGKYLLDYQVSYTQEGRKLIETDPQTVPECLIIFDYNGKLYEYKCTFDEEKDYFTLDFIRNLSESAYAKLNARIGTIGYEDLDVSYLMISE
jgi:hypothetical protein